MEAPPTASVYGPEVASSGPAAVADMRSADVGGDAKIVTLSGSRVGGVDEPGFKAAQRRTLCC